MNDRHSSRNDYGRSQSPAESGGGNKLQEYKSLIQTKRFVDDAVLDLGDGLAKELQKRGDETKTQMRKFYNLVRVAETAATTENPSLDLVRVKLRLLKAQVAYAAARGSVSGSFKTFFDASSERILKPGVDFVRELSDFARFFEAFYAYFYYHSESEKNR